MSQFYESSGAVPPIGIVLAMIGGAVTAALTGVLYEIALAYIPFIIICFILPFCYGGLVGLAVGYLGMLGKVRNTIVLCALGGFMGVFALYLSWAFDFWARSGFEQMILFNPLSITAYMAAVMENGMWSLFGWTPTGFALAFFWLLEGLIIVGTSAVIPSLVMGQRVFCERCDQWADTKEGVRFFHPEAVAVMGNHLMNGDWAAVKDSPAGDPDSPHFLRIDLTSCQDCRECNYVTLSEVRVSVNDDGNPETDVDYLVSNLKLSWDDLTVLKSH